MTKTVTLRFAKQNKETWQFIKDGKKKVETRAATVKYRSIKTGDTLVLSCDGKKFNKKIKKVTHFKTISSLLKVYKSQTINPLLKTKEEMIVRWYSFPGYEQKIKKFGIMAFELK